MVISTSSRRLLQQLCFSSSSRRSSSSSSSSSSRRRNVLYYANLGIIEQKLSLINLMNIKFGSNDAYELYKKTCPIVNASIGQHIRHSIDHIELVIKTNMNIIKNNFNEEGIMINELHYDLRQRGNNDEYDITIAKKRIQSIESILNDLILYNNNYTTNNNTTTNKTTNKTKNETTITTPVNAYFMLSADPMEFQLSSTIERELGFVTHHAIHHMALVKIIAIQTIGILPNELPSDFGRAPSTLVHDMTIIDEQQQEEKVVQEDEKKTS